MTTQTLRTLMQESRDIVVFTGAGISAESGVPTYRGDGGMWNAYDPDKYANINFFHQDPSYYWRFFRDVRYPALSRAKPNPAHTALASLERMGCLRALITQNIDGLHQAAGSQRVLELHGSTRVYHCLQGGHELSMDQAYQLLQTSLPPKCPQCGSLIRPGTVMFGEGLPRGVLQDADTAARNADLFVCIGSSLVVHPAASLPVVAKQQGASLVIINKDQTPLDPMADLVLRASATETLVPIVQEMEQSKESRCRS